MAKLTQDGSLDPNWMDPFNSAGIQDPTDPAADPTLGGLNRIFAQTQDQPNPSNDPTGGGTPPNPTTPGGTTPTTPPTGLPVIPPGSIIPGTQPNPPGTTGTTPGGAISWADPSVLNQPGFANTGNFGGGWDQSWATPTARALQLALANGQSGQAAIDWIKKTYPNIDSSQISYDPTKNAFGLPGNMYAAANPDKNGIFDLIQRSGTEGSSSTHPGSQVNDVLSNLLTKLFGAGAADPNATLRSQLSSKFGSLMDQYSQPVSPDDPIIKANTDAYHGIEERNLGQYGEMAAERAHAEGVPVGAFDSSIGNATSSAGRDEALNTSGLMTNETNARRAALGGVLGQASQFSQVTDAQKLQEELAVLSDATGNQQFYDSLASGLGGQQNSLDALIASLLGK